MLTATLLLLGLSGVPHNPKPVMSLAALDAACRREGPPQTMALPLDSGSLRFPGDPNEQGLYVRRPLRSLRGAVQVHVVDPPALTWSGPAGRQMALRALSRGEARALLLGTLAREPGFPACFGHPRSSHRSVSMKLNAVLLRGPNGQPLGRFYPAPRHRPQRPGGGATLSIRCGAACSHTDAELETALGSVDAALRKCAAGAPEGSLAVELRIAAESTGGTRAVLQGEVSSLPERVRSCTRDALEALRFPTRKSSGTVLIEMRVADARVPTIET